MRRPEPPPVRRSHPLLLLLGVLLVPVVALMDFLAGPEYAFSLFYLIPIVVVARLGGWTSAWFTAVFAAIAWVIIDVLTSPNYTTPIAPIWNSLTRFAFFAFALVAVRGYEEQLQRARLRALSDPLTGLPNRQFLMIMLDAATARLERNRVPLTLAYIDIDDFKSVNDRHGHRAGDDVLRLTGQILLDSTRDTDTVARMGGDEFVVLLPDADANTARAVLDRVRERLNRTTVETGTGATYSIGACTFHRALESVEAMIREADEQMYRVKRTGKDAVEVVTIA